MTTYLHELARLLPVVASHDPDEQARDQIHAARCVAKALSPSHDRRVEIELHILTCDTPPELTHADRLYAAALAVLEKRLRLDLRLACAAELVKAISTCMALGETLPQAVIACITHRATTKHDSGQHVYPGWDRISEGRALILYQTLIRVKT